MLQSHLCTCEQVCLCTIICLCSWKELKPIILMHRVLVPLTFIRYWRCCSTSFVLQGLLWCCVLTNSEVLLSLQFPSLSFTYFKAFFSSQHWKSSCKHHSETPVLPFFWHFVHTMPNHTITGRKPTVKCCSIIRVSIRAITWQPINSLFFTHPSVFFPDPAIHSRISQSIY